MTSLYETNILNQPLEWKRILDSSLPTELKNLRANKIIFIEIGSSYWAARIAEFLWKEYNTAASMTTTTIPTLKTTPYSIQSFDFVRSKHPVSKNDIVVVFSHRGTKTFSIKALEIAKENGATTVLITDWKSPYQ